MQTLKVRSSEREELVDITREVERLVRDSGRDSGICHLYTQHTTCGLTINENADPDVKSDMLGFLRRLIPQYDPLFRHFEHNSDAHIKSSLVGCSASIPFADKKLLLGRWQGIYLCEFDGPRERSVLASLVGSLDNAS
jgi:secondary thiamine-phosphate synthase enzyme